MGCVGITHTATLTDTVTHGRSFALFVGVSQKEAAYADSDGYVYSRWGSPTTEAAAMQVAALEAPHGVAAEDVHTMVFSSGMSAITAALISALQSGDHAIFPQCVYGGTHEFLSEFAPRWGIEVSFVDAQRGPVAYAEARVVRRGRSGRWRRTNTARNERVRRPLLVRRHSNARSNEDPGVARRTNERPPRPTPPPWGRRRGRTRACCTPRRLRTPRAG